MQEPSLPDLLVRVLVQIIRFLSTSALTTVPALVRLEEALTEHEADDLDRLPGLPGKLLLRPMFNRLGSSELPFAAVCIPSMSDDRASNGTAVVDDLARDEKDKAAIEVGAGSLEVDKGEEKRVLPLLLPIERRGSSCP